MSTHPFDTHALCRFPARLRFLQAHLSLTNLPNVPCAEYDSMRAYLNPKHLSIIFPSAYFNSPASLFGHTFLLIEGDFDSRLLAYSLNFAARADEQSENGFVFAIRGLLGLYEGYYTMLPYYETLKNYKDTESRDIWEFRINFSEHEVLRAFEHIWELREIYSDYFFFDENCSYNLLWILEAARPSLRLRDAFTYHVIPPETLFVLDENNLLGAMNYRPSKRTVLGLYTSQLSFGEIATLRALASGSIQPETRGKGDSLLLEAALELNEYNYIARKTDKDSYTQIAHDLAKARSRLGASPPVVAKTPASPMLAHRSARVFLGMLHKDGAQSSNALALEARIAYHDRSESDRGLLAGTQIEFVRLMLGYEHLQSQGDKLRVEDFALLSLASFVPHSKLFSPFSYRLFLGAKPILDDSLAPYAQVGAGASVGGELAGGEVLGYYLFEILGADANGALAAAIQTLGASLDSYPLKLTLEASNRIYTTQAIENELQGTIHWQFAHHLALFGRGQWRAWQNVQAPKKQRRRDNVLVGMR
ncbi:MAG: DUF4105 domain-containing protein, partial [Helicobacter sp.]|nr:DUF4105 domain-containing protein [Helicobacter sp.]